MGWYINSFSIPFDFGKRQDEAYLKSVKQKVLRTINEYIKHNGLYSDSGAIMPKFDTSFIYENKAEAEKHIQYVIEDRGYDFSVAVPYNDFSAMNGEYEHIMSEIRQTELNRREILNSASSAVLARTFIKCRNCGHQQAVGTLDDYRCIFCNSDVRSATKMNKYRVLIRKQIRLEDKCNEMKYNKKNIFLLIRFAFHC